jgi:serine/threonine-protein kinase
MGIARAHDARLVHNDIKPGNLFLTALNDCVVGDFGLATLLPPPPLIGAARGATPHTAAPEVASGWPYAAPATFTTDVYSLGATAFWLLAGTPPIDFGAVVGINAMMAVVAGNPPRRLRDVAPHVPLSVASIVEKAIAASPADRYQSAAAFAAALGSRSAKPRRWKRTDEHGGHLGCWRGEQLGRSTYVLCVEPGPTPTRCVISTRHDGSGVRVSGGARVCATNRAAQAVRGIIDRLS